MTKLGTCTLPIALHNLKDGFDTKIANLIQLSFFISENAKEQQDFKIWKPITPEHQYTK